MSKPTSQVISRVPGHREHLIDAWERAAALREHISVRRKGEPLPSSAAVIRELREERDREL